MESEKKRQQNVKEYVLLYLYLKIEATLFKDKIVLSNIVINYFSSKTLFFFLVGTMHLRIIIY